MVPLLSLRDKGTRSKASTWSRRTEGQTEAGCAFLISFLILMMLQ